MSSIIDQVDNLLFPIEHHDDLSAESFAQSETIVYIQLLINNTILRPTLRHIGRLNIAHLIPPIPAKLTDTVQHAEQQAQMLETKRSVNTLQMLLSRLYRLKSNITSTLTTDGRGTIKIPPAFTSELLGIHEIGRNSFQSTTQNQFIAGYQQQIDQDDSTTTSPQQLQILHKSLNILRDDASYTTNLIYEWLQGIEHEELQHQKFLKNTFDQLQQNVSLYLLFVMLNGIINGNHITGQEYEGASGSFLNHQRRRNSKQTQQHYGFFGDDAIQQQQQQQQQSLELSHYNNNINNHNGTNNVAQHGFDLDHILFHPPQVKQHHNSLSASSPHNTNYGSYNDNQNNNFYDDDVEDHNNNNNNPETSSYTIYGVIPTHLKYLLNVQVYRISRGNVLTTYRDFTLEQQAELFSTFTNGEQINSAYLKKHHHSSTTTTSLNSNTALNNTHDLQNTMSPAVINAHLYNAMPILKHHSNFDKQQNNNNTINNNNTQNNTTNQMDNNENADKDQNFVHLSTFMFVFPKTTFLYNKILKLCNTYHVKTFALPNISKLYPLFAASGSANGNSLFFQQIVHTLQNSIQSIIITRISTYAAIQRLYYDACCYKYNEPQQQEQQLLQQQQADGGLSSTNMQQNIGRLLQITTNITLLTEELAILTAGQYVKAYNQHHNDNEVSFDSNTTNGLSNNVTTTTITTTTTTNYQHSILSLYIPYKYLPFFQEQMKLIDDGNSDDGFSVLPIINKKLIFTRDNYLKYLQYKSNDPATPPLHTDERNVFSHIATIGQDPPSLFSKKPLFLPVQELINTYSIPSYKELNPAMITIATFPILFGVMFGDVIHGLALFIISLVLYFKYWGFSSSSSQQEQPYDKVSHAIQQCDALATGPTTYNEVLLLETTTKSSSREVAAKNINKKKIKDGKLYQPLVANKTNKNTKKQTAIGFIDNGNNNTTTNGDQQYLFDNTDEDSENHNITGLESSDIELYDSADSNNSNTQLGNRNVNNKDDLHQQSNINNLKNNNNNSLTIQNNNNNNNIQSLPKSKTQQYTQNDYVITPPLINSNDIPIATQYPRVLQHLFENTNVLIISKSFTRGLILWLGLIGLCSVYMGLIYNDAAANPLHLFSSWYFSDAGMNEQKSTGNGVVLLETSSYWVYPFGIDPAWYHTPYELTMLNSFKMKMSIILGICHLFLGLICSLYNNIYFKNNINILLIWLPQILMLFCTFGYMCILIIYKWCIDYRYLNYLYFTQSNVVNNIQYEPPSIIQVMINMFLTPNQPIKQELLLFKYQYEIQVLFLLITLICIPILFCGKPLYTYQKHKKWVILKQKQMLLKRKGQYNNNNNFDDDDLDGLFLLNNIDKKKNKNSDDGDNDTTTTTDDSDNHHHHNNIINNIKNDDTLLYDNGRYDIPSRQSLLSLSSIQEQEEQEKQNTLIDKTNSNNSSGGGNSGNSGNNTENNNITTLSQLPLHLKNNKSNNRSPQNTYNTFENTTTTTTSPIIKQCDDTNGHNNHGDTNNDDEHDDLNPYNINYSLSSHFVHHCIHCIEYTLGIVSNTASYLRLWALSLAHAQLSNVFWSQLIVNLGVKSNNMFILLISFIMWCIATTSVLLLMDVLECILHSVRLHWIELNSKFFMGNGLEFQIFNLFSFSTNTGGNGSNNSNDSDQQYYKEIILN